MEDKREDIILSIRGMSKSFGRNRVLDHINLDVKRGTVMGLMGENGAGKSTLMKCLFGIYKMDAGEIYLDGEKIDIKDPDDAMSKGIAMVVIILNKNNNEYIRLYKYSIKSLSFKTSLFCFALFKYSLCLISKYSFIILFISLFFSAINFSFSCLFIFVPLSTLLFLLSLVPPHFLIVV